MKNLNKPIITLLFLFISTITFSQEVIGDWNGILSFQGIQLRLVFHINLTDSGLMGTMDSPDQGARGIPVSSIDFNSPSLILKVANAGITYEGILNDSGSITGTFKQAGQSIPLNLFRKQVEKVNISRPQDPVKPYPYYSEKITFKNADAGINLSGTLTLPQKEGLFPAVILISGSGPQNRDEELMGHKPFLVLSDYLTKNGIAVLRYDDRGTFSSTGNFSKATSYDFSTDVEAAVKYLQTRNEINHKKIGLIGHSEGGIIAPLVASRCNQIAFIVLLAGTGISGDSLLFLQQQLISKAYGLDEDEIKEATDINREAFKIINNTKDSTELNKKLKNLISTAIDKNPKTKIPEGTSKEDFIRLQVEQLASPWMQYFLKYDPSTALKKVTVPVLALNGENDLQVPAKENIDAIKTALTLGGNKNVTTVILPGLNHLFQKSATGSPAEYALIEQTFSPDALSVILKWIIDQTR